MEKYWESHPRSTQSTGIPTNDADIQVTASVMSDFDRYHRRLVSIEDDEGWQSELRRYLKDMPAEVTAETDIIRYWQVRVHFLSIRLYFKSHITVAYRTITTAIPSLDILHSTFSQFLRLLFLANIFFLLPRKLQMIVARVWVQRSSRNSRS